MIKNYIRSDLISKGFLTPAPRETDPDSTILDSNENPVDTDDSLNRYPFPEPLDLRKKLSVQYRVSEHFILVTRGSSEGIELMMRACCAPGIDSIAISEPTFNLYRELALLYKLNVKNDVDSSVKLCYVCTPNNPTGASLTLDQISKRCRELSNNTVLVLDEAYIEYSSIPSASCLIEEFDNLVILRTLSKAYGLAGLRCGAMIANPEWIQFLKTIMMPFAIPTPVINWFSENTLKLNIERIKTERDRLFHAFSELPCVERVWPSDANFLLVKFKDLDAVLKACLEHKIKIRDCRQAFGLDGCARITVGLPDQNNKFLMVLSQQVNFTCRL